MTKESAPPDGWDKTIQDLVDEIEAGTRAGISGQEADWARAYARSLLPKEIRFPEKDDVFELLEDLEATYMTSWAAPGTGSGTGMIFKGERFVLDYEPCEKPISVYLDPIDYEVLEKRLVPVEEREHELYAGFYFSVDTIDLNTKFKLVEL